MEGVCEYIYNISKSECHNLEKNDMVFVTLLAANILGKGQSYNHKIGTTLILKVTCIFFIILLLCLLTYRILQHICFSGDRL